MWVLVAASLLLSGCHAIVGRGVSRLVRQPVCPVCHATSVDQCHCFPVAESGGYCETSWVSLEPALSLQPTVPADAFPAEELPTPEALFTPEESGTVEERGAEVPEAPEITQVVAYWENQPATHPRKSRLPVSLRVTDKRRLRAADGRRQSQ